MSGFSMSIWKNEHIPLCFDTSVFFVRGKALPFFRKVREQFPERTLIVPAAAIAEHARQLMARRGRTPEEAVIELKTYLDDDDNGLTVGDFNSAVALYGWVKVTGHFDEQIWKWQKRPVPKSRSEQPCGERCRVGDHAIYATALTHGALLVTSDKSLIDQVQGENTYPGAVYLEDFRVALNKMT